MPRQEAKLEATGRLWSLPADQLTFHHRTLLGRERRNGTRQLQSRGNCGGSVLRRPDPKPRHDQHLGRVRGSRRRSTGQRSAGGKPGLPSTRQYSYGTLRGALASSATSSADTSFVASLPAAAPVAGHFWVTSAQSKGFGLSPATSAATDGYVGFSGSAAFSDDDTLGVAPGTYDFNAVAVHEKSGGHGTHPAWRHHAWQHEPELRFARLDALFQCGSARLLAECARLLSATADRRALANSTRAEGMRATGPVRCRVMRSTQPPTRG